MFTQHLQNIWMIFIGGSRGGVGGPDPYPRKSQVAIDFLRNSVLDRKQIVDFQSITFLCLRLSRDKSIKTCIIPFYEHIS